MFVYITNMFYSSICSSQSILSPYCSYASFVMSREVDADYPDVCRQVIRSDRVKDAIRDAAEDEFNELQDDEAGTVNTISYQLVSNYFKN